MSEESKSWYRMTRPLFNSGFEDDEFWAYGQDGFQEVLESFLGSDVEIYDKAIAKQPQSVRAIVQQVTGDTYSTSTVRQILCNIGILHCGQYVRYDGAWWLVIGFPDNNRIYEKAVLWKCKHSIRFLSPLTGEAVEYPVYSENSTQYGTGQSEKTYMTVGDDQHLIYLPYNAETILLDDDFRFIMDKNHVNPSVYRITRVDPVSYAVGDEAIEDGLIQWSVLQTQFNEETDNRELMIADYYTAKLGESNSTSGDGGSLILTDADGDYRLAIGETKEVYVSYTDENGEAASEFSYSVSCEAENVTVTQDGQTIRLSADNDARCIGSSIMLTARAFESEATMTIQIVGW